MTIQHGVSCFRFLYDGTPREFFPVSLMRYIVQNFGRGLGFGFLKFMGQHFNPLSTLHTVVTSLLGTRFWYDYNYIGNNNFSWGG